METTKKRQSHCDLFEKSKRPRSVKFNVLDLPDEIILKIFSELPELDLILNVRLVNQRFRCISEDHTLCRKIDGRQISTKLLQKMISTAPLLEHFIINDRKNLPKLLKTLAENSRNLKTLKVYRAWNFYSKNKYSFLPKMRYLSCPSFCNLFESCPKLQNMWFDKYITLHNQFCNLLRTNMTREWSFTGSINATTFHRFLELTEYTSEEKRKACYKFFHANWWLRINCNKSNKCQILFLETCAEKYWFKRHYCVVLS